MSGTTTTSMRCEVLQEAVALVEFTNAHDQNPFSRARMRELTRLLTDLDQNPEVGAVVLYGGAGRSFGAGGDFNEVSEFSGGDEVDAWVDDITDLYSTIAGITKPVVGAIDGHAIGVGLQIALCCDLRIGSTAARLVMPEFQVGIACNFGGYMLETVVGRSVMQEMLYTCDEWQADRALRDGLLHEVAAPAALLDAAVKHARRIASYTSAAVQSTRARVNGPYVAGLRRVQEEGKRSHRTAFSAGEAQQRMRRIIGKA
ncbi:enoyl-CoA hydratase/isomerase family protein [Streptomyces sp. NPDC021212]|uniref:enoyl-CoA hydratase/isomerase family protein n=1 Tax=Streptomyces sp. NPDC021212 TaxID=3365118 RepID=UPI0037AE5C7F